MSAPPAGQRKWTCPDCGTEILLPKTRLDPLACDACLSKLKGSPSTSARSANSGIPIAALIIGGVVAAAIVFFVGLAVGFAIGRYTAPTPFVRPARPTENDTITHHRDTESTDDTNLQEPDESTRPGPDYKWVKGYVRKDGVHVKGYWAKDRSKPK